MTKVYYACHCRVGDSVTISYKTLPDVTPLRRGLLRRSKGIARESLTMMADARVVKWDYEAREGRLRDPGQIAQHIFDGYCAKKKQKIDDSIPVCIGDKIYRLTCKVTRRRTDVQQLAAKVRVIQSNTYTYDETERVKLQRDFERVKGCAQAAIDEGERILREFQQTVADTIHKVEDKIRAAEQKLSHLWELKQALEDRLERMKKSFFDKLHFGHKHKKDPESLWNDHLQKDADASSLQKELDENAHMIAAAQASHGKVCAKARNMFPGFREREARLQNNLHRLREELAQLSAGRTARGSF